MKVSMVAVSKKHFWFLMRGTGVLTLFAANLFVHICQGLAKSESIIGDNPCIVTLFKKLGGLGAIDNRPSTI